ncbi:formylglycine-generating enzyme family protein [Kibdelosporangium phytohabitans]|uniref:Serine/threonine protein kinase n=1 Tax=Kibdelosporangium phytohabitans TaxID=860235 RepID=A0A0N9HWK7_9PSEU|nr:SUMF1/EgtB/PvdO family nonheme iron enzyme [Kibdelosporangium phytohabitans]ALG09667.1 serine/threonine protein kinase [Kibdelosporangium phytohabitans]MBE1468987.1 formylglycine-generating enzyme required for sulfatase activity [Kibdelosporangium phytohabitans]
MAPNPAPVAANPNALGDREAMGLPGHLAERLPSDVFARHRDLLRDTPERLVARCEDGDEPFERRYVAGSVLGMLGDPRVDPDDPRMVDVPAGRAELGLPEDQVDAVVAQWAPVGVVADWIRKECPRHSVVLPSFRIMRYPVTNLEYRAFLRDTGTDALPSSWLFGGYPHQRANHPVWTVRPDQADAYAAWLAARTGRRFRLPSEAEWEYAAGGGVHEYPWGGQFLPDHANTVEDGPLCTTPVGLYPAGRSPFGADDMAGNVEEFVADDYAAYPGGAPVDDDLKRDGQSYRVARGGSFTRFGDLARCTRRHGWFDRDLYAIGFRLAEDA